MFLLRTHTRPKAHSPARCSGQGDPQVACKAPIATRKLTGNRRNPRGPRFQIEGMYPKRPKTISTNSNRETLHAPYVGPLDPLWLGVHTFYLGPWTLRVRVHLRVVEWSWHFLTFLFTGG